MAHDVNQSELDVAAQVRSALVDKVSADRIELWLPHDALWTWKEGTLCIYFQNEFACQTAKRMLANDISDAMVQVLGFAAEIEFRAVAGERLFDKRASRGVVPTQTIKVPSEAIKATEKKSKVDAFERNQAGATSGQLALNARENCGEPTPMNTPARVVDLWEQFVQGNSNQLAWTTANLVVSEPGRLSPVVLHGPNGCGKSHLASAVAERLRSVRRLRRVVHMSSEQFTNDFMEGLRGGGLPMFRRKYRDVEALILDDIQFFVGKKSTIGELKHTLDNLLKAGKQIVLTSDRTLNELSGLGSDLIGRLRSGMVTPIFPLDEQTRSGVMSRMISAAGLDISQEIIEQIAARTAGDGRVLSGIAKRLIAVSALHAQKLSWDQCWSAVCDLVQATQPVIRIADIELAVCRMFGLEPDSLQSDSKSRSVSQPRMLAMFLSRKYTPAAYKEIGDYFGKRRHSTVISAEKTVAAWLDENSNMKVGRGLTIRDAIRHVESQLQVG